MAERGFEDHLPHAGVCYGGISRAPLRLPPRAPASVRGQAAATPSPLQNNLQVRIVIVTVRC